MATSATKEHDQAEGPTPTHGKRLERREHLLLDNVEENKAASCGKFGSVGLANDGDIDSADDEILIGSS